MSDTIKKWHEMQEEKILTDELIEKMMLKKGFKLDIDSDEARKFVLDHYDVTIEDSWCKSDFMIYPETTADGYEVFIATNSDSNINISEHVYYYEDRLGEALSQAIEDYCDGTIYLDFDINESWVEETFSEMYQHLYEEQEQELTNELESEGYEY